MADLTPLHDLVAEWCETGHESQGGDSPEVDELRRWHIFQLNQAIAAIESANPWILVEKGLPEPSDTVFWDVWREGLAPWKLVREVYLSASHEESNSPHTLWVYTGFCGVAAVTNVTHYRRHVPEKGPSE